MSEVTFTIDGQRIIADEGATVLEAALANDVYIPHLCHHPDLDPYGGCRLCLVEIAGRLEIACRTPVRPDLIVQTETEGVDAARRTALELLLADHPSDCTTCRQNGDCSLQDAAAYLAIDPDRLARLRRQTDPMPVDESNPFFRLDPNYCILCGICVRTCSEIAEVHALDFVDRGFDTKIGTFADQPIKDSRCVSCGECVSRCPVGALVPTGFEKPAREVRTVCPYCGVGCGIHLGVRGDRIVSVRAERENPTNRGTLCVKGRFGQGYVNSPDRLTNPLVRENGILRDATWDEALDLVAEKLAAIKTEHGPDAIGTLSSAKCTNEENYLLQKLTRAVIGTNNVDHCARL